jgi:hypothetical protein
MVLMVWLPGGIASIGDRFKKAPVPRGAAE